MTIPLRTTVDTTEMRAAADLAASGAVQALTPVRVTNHRHLELECTYVGAGAGGSVRVIPLRASKQNPDVAPAITDDVWRNLYQDDLERTDVALAASGLTGYDIVIPDLSVVSAKALAFDIAAGNAETVRIGIELRVGAASWMTALVREVGNTGSPGNLTVVGHCYA